MNRTSIYKKIFTLLLSFFLFTSMSYSIAEDKKSEDTKEESANADQAKSEEAGDDKSKGKKAEGDEEPECD